MANLRLAFVEDFLVKALGAALLKRQSSTKYQGIKRNFRDRICEFTVIHHAAFCNGTGIGAVG